MYHKIHYDGNMSEQKITERKTSGHGYSAGCECDLVGGDPDCKIRPPYETVEDYISKLRAQCAELTRKLEELEMQVRLGQQKYSDYRREMCKELESQATLIRELGEALDLSLYFMGMFTDSQLSFKHLRGRARDKMKEIRSILAKLPREAQSNRHGADDKAARGSHLG